MACKPTQLPSKCILLFIKKCSPFQRYSVCWFHKENESIPKAGTQQQSGEKRKRSFFMKRYFKLMFEAIAQMSYAQYLVK